MRPCSYELNPLHCASFIERETVDSDDEAADADADDGVDPLDRCGSGTGLGKDP